MIEEIIQEENYRKRLMEYNKCVDELAEKRKKFYEDNPNFPLKYMYVNVIASPKKFIINYVQFNKNKVM